jgi:hypothetical protein
MRYLSYFSIVLILSAPERAQAQTDMTFRDVVTNVTGLVQLVIPILTAAALLVFFFGLADYIFQAGDQSAVETGKYRMIAGVVGLFVIAAVWGLVAIVAGTFDLGLGSGPGV